MAEIWDLRFKSFQECVPHLVSLWNRHNSKIPIEEARLDWPWADPARTTITSDDLEDISPNGREIQYLLAVIGEIPNAVYSDPATGDAYYATYVHNWNSGAIVSEDTWSIRPNTPQWLESVIGKKPDCAHTIRRCWSGGGGVVCFPAGVSVGLEGVSKRRNLCAPEIADYLYWCEMMMDKMKIYVPLPHYNYKNEEECGGVTCCEDQGGGVYLCDCDCYEGYMEHFEWYKPYYKQRPSDYIVTEDTVYLGWSLKDTGSCCDPSDGDPRNHLAVGQFGYARTSADQQLSVSVTTGPIESANFDFLRTVMSGNKILDVDFDRDSTRTIIEQSNMSCYDVGHEGRKILVATSDGHILLYWSDGQLIYDFDFSTEGYPDVETTFVRDIRFRRDKAELIPSELRDLDHYPTRMIADCHDQFYIAVGNVVHCYHIKPDETTGLPELLYTLTGHTGDVYKVHQLYGCLITHGAFGEVKKWSIEGALLSTDSTSHGTATVRINGFLSDRLFNEAPSEEEEEYYNSALWATGDNNKKVVFRSEDSVTSSASLADDPTAICCYPPVIGDASGNVYTFSLDDNPYPFDEDPTFVIATYPERITHIQRGVCGLEPNYNLLRGRYGDIGTGAWAFIRLFDPPVVQDIHGNPITTGELWDLLGTNDVIDEIWSEITNDSPALACGFQDYIKEEINLCSVKNCFYLLGIPDCTCRSEDFRLSYFLDEPVQGRFVENASVDSSTGSWNEIGHYFEEKLFFNDLYHLQRCITHDGSRYIVDTSLLPFPVEDLYISQDNIDVLFNDDYHKGQANIIKLAAMPLLYFNMEPYTGTLFKTIWPYNTKNYNMEVFETGTIALGSDFGEKPVPLNPNNSEYRTYGTEEGYIFTVSNLISTSWPEIGVFNEDPLEIIFSTGTEAPFASVGGFKNIKGGNYQTYLTWPVICISKEDV